jgi:hypothetical protein
MPDSAEVDRAIVNRLSADAALLALTPDGVYVNEAKQGKTKFTLVSMISGLDTGQMAEAPAPRRALEDVLYAIKAVIMDSSRTAAGNAAKRIDELMEDQPLTIVGYGCLSVERTERIDETEVDEIDKSIRWQHRGGRYRVLVSPV